jgi:hypothetical protein
VEVEERNPPSRELASGTDVSFGEKVVVERVEGWWDGVWRYLLWVDLSYSAVEFSQEGQEVRNQYRPSLLLVLSFWMMV